jgi:UDP-N-acetylglucosamine 2-epimerase (non-hydrolysing)
MQTEKIKVSVFVGTRPESIKLFPIIRELRARPKRFTLRVIATSQHRDMLRQMLTFFDVTADVDFQLMQPGQTLASTTAKALYAMERELTEFRPDIALVQGDTTTALSCALAAYYQNVAVGHVEAGIRSGNPNYPFPEEANRQIISRISLLHFAPTVGAKENLLKEGISQERIFVTGNTVVDSLRYVLSQQMQMSESLQSIIKNSKKLILVTLHRREIHGAQLRSLCKGIRAAARSLQSYTFIVPVHPNPVVQGTMCETLSEVTNIKLTEPQDYFSFVQLMSAASLIVTDSGGIQEEAPYLGKMVLVVRNETDRPESIALGLAKLVGTDGANLADEIQAAAKVSTIISTPTSGHPFGDGRSARTIADILEAHL